MNVTVVLLPGLNGTDGLFQPLLDVAPDGIDVLPVSYPTPESKTYEELSS